MHPRCRISMFMERGYFCGALNIRFVRRNMTCTDISDSKHGRPEIGLSTRNKYFACFCFQFCTFFNSKFSNFKDFGLKHLYQLTMILTLVLEMQRENINFPVIVNPLYFMVFRFLCFSEPYERHSAFRTIHTTRHARRSLPQSRSLFIIRNCPLLTALTDPKYHLRAVSCRLLDI